MTAGRRAAQLVVTGCVLCLVAWLAAAALIVRAPLDRADAIVTSAYHSRRALWTVRRVLSGSRIEVGIDPAEPGLETPRPGVRTFTLRGWRDVPEEYLKLIYYRVRYR
jgi:hypothetical protein